MAISSGDISCKPIIQSSDYRENASDYRENASDYKENSSDYRENVTVAEVAS